MSLSLKGFITDNTLVNNTPGETARFGELSTHCRTFAKDVQSLTTASWPNVEISVFSHRSTTGTTQMQVNHVFGDLLLEFAGWLLDSGRVFTANTQQTDVVAAIVNRFNDYVTNVTVDKMVGANGVYLPTRIQMTVQMNGFEALEVVLWTANAEFETGYDEDEIVVIPPIDAIDTFMATYAAVATAMSVVNAVRDMARVETAKAKKPPTHLIATSISWVDPTQPTRKVATTWYTLIYGSRGNTSDRINEALRQYILGKSTSPESNWRLVMPDLFRVTRFLVVPLWSATAIQGRTALPSIYSPIASLSDINSVMNTISPQASVGTQNFEVLNHPFRSLSLVFFAGSDNREDARTLRQTVPDYIATESTVEDFNRQSLNTMEFSNMLGNLIRAAEAYTVGTSQATGVRVVQFDGYTCLATKHDNVEYVMRTRLQG